MAFSTSVCSQSASSWRRFLLSLGGSERDAGSRVTNRISTAPHGKTPNEDTIVTDAKRHVGCHSDRENDTQNQASEEAKGDLHHSACASQCATISLSVA